MLFLSPFKIHTGQFWQKSCISPRNLFYQEEEITSCFQLVIVRNLIREIVKPHLSNLSATSATVQNTVRVQYRLNSTEFPANLR